ncbi:TGF-beta-activated kinase 1 and MAP3K7-binding protein 2-like isoform X12 [Palaemon carinicauda]|uniref:TGF-beta-activated kinase 1 and MAP3K7-binding protein 2-like isoform X12 n=1 Tax=Palaemon carinicauda TaxID=392227 RepID=UPI0035B6794C
MASDDRLPADTRNIPHMQLFHHLKQKFPDLRDNDVNESIQKYGLDRERCEEELSQKALIQRGGYYRHWSRSGSSLSSPTLSRVTSPIRTGIPSTPTTPVLTTTPASYHHITATQHVCGPVQSNGYLVCSYPTEMVPELRPVYTTVCQTPVTTNPMLCTPVVSNSPLYSWHPSASNGFRAAGIQPPRPGVVPCNTEDTPFSSREPSQSRSVTPPNSAPVTSSFDPFSAFENKEPVRRRSAETHLDGRKGLYYNKHNFENFCPSEHSPTPPIRNSAMDSPVTSTTTTTTFTRSYNVDPVNINGGNTNRPPPAIVQEQSIRKQKLATELAKQIEEKGKLQSEVEMMMRELEARENQRKRNADSNTKRIEEVQRENQRLQSECDEMENKILRIAPDIGQDDYSGIPSSQPYHEPPVAPQLIRASSGSSLGSGTGTPQTPHTPYTPQIPGTYIPPRPAAPPPPPPVPNFRGFQGVPGDTVEERTPKWGCTKCTFLNHPDMNKCEMCECPRFTIGTASSHHAALPPHHQGPCYCHRQHAPGAVAGSIGAAAANSLHHTYSSLPLVANEKPSLSNFLKEKLIGLRDRSDSV